MQEILKYIKILRIIAKIPEKGRITIYGDEIFEKVEGAWKKKNPGF